MSAARLPASLPERNNERMARRGSDDPPDLSTIRGRFEWALKQCGHTKLSLAHEAGLDQSRFSRDMKRPSGEVVHAVTTVTGLDSRWWLKGTGTPWQPGREPRPEEVRNRDKRTREGREGPAQDAEAALEEYPFDEGADYRRARALAASDMVRLHGWKASRVMADIGKFIERFHEPHGTTDRQIADGIVSTMVRARAEEEGTAKVKPAPSRDPALAPKRLAARPRDGSRR
jgi:hypothetical protein